MRQAWRARHRQTTRSRQARNRKSATNTRNRPIHVRTKVACAQSQSEHTRQASLALSRREKARPRPVEARTVIAIAMLGVATGAVSCSAVSPPIDSLASATLLRTQQTRMVSSIEAQREHMESRAGAKATQAAGRTKIGWVPIAAGLRILRKRSGSCRRMPKDAHRVHRAPQKSVRAI